MKIYFFQKKKKFFEMKYISRISSQILENPKNFMDFIFFPLSFNGKNLWPNFHFRFCPRMEKIFFSQKNILSIVFSKNKTLFLDPKQNEIFGTSSGRTQDVFPFFSRGRKSHRVESDKPSETFPLERGNKVYHRKADHKLFHISKEDPILVARIEGEELLFPGRDPNKVGSFSNEISESNQKRQIREKD